MEGERLSSRVVEVHKEEEHFVPRSLTEPLLSLDPNLHLHLHDDDEDDDDDALRDTETADELRALIRKIIGETLASFMAIFAMLALRVNTYGNGFIATIANALFGGLIVTITIFSLGHVSGSHINPIVTIAYTAITHFPLQLAPLYLSAQFIGGIMASLAIKLIFRPSWSIVVVTLQTTILQSLLVETITGFLLLFVASSVATDNRAIGQFAGLAIGGIMAVNIMIAAPISGAGLNPSRALGTALVGWEFENLWIYFVGPIIGSLLGAFVYSLLRPNEVRKKGVHNPINIKRIRTKTIRRVFSGM